jgi:hypothetical protein
MPIQIAAKRRPPNNPTSFNFNSTVASPSLVSFLKGPWTGHHCQLSDNKVNDCAGRELPGFLVVS